MRRAITIYALILIFVGSERLLRQGQAATSLDASETDEGTTRAIGSALARSVVLLLLAPFLNRLHIARLPGQRLLFRTGALSMLGGILLRVWATRVLGTSYTRTLRTAEDQRIIDEGPYAVVRHPGYLGTLLVWIGAALAFTNALVAATVTGLLVSAYRKRIASEERMLLGAFGDEYRTYRSRTKRLVPFVY